MGWNHMLQSVTKSAPICHFGIIEVLKKISYVHPCYVPCYGHIPG